MPTWIHDHEHGPALRAEFEVLSTKLEALGASPVMLQRVEALFKASMALTTDGLMCSGFTGFLPTYLRTVMAIIFTHARFGGYECSSKGDRRFSALFARLSDGRTIEMHYQCDVKGYQPGGTNWRLGKGKPPLNPSIDLYAAYKALWLEWAENHKPEMRELYVAAKKTNGVLSDMFATGPISQARALADILNDWSRP